MPTFATLCRPQMLRPRVGLTRRRGVNQIELRDEVTIPKDRQSVRPYESVRVARPQEDVHAGRLKARLGVAIGSHPGPAEEIEHSHSAVIRALSSSEMALTTVCSLYSVTDLLAGWAF